MVCTPYEMIRILEEPTDFIRLYVKVSGKIDILLSLLLGGRVVANSGSVLQ